MKNLRVSMKMALGFGLVLAITCALGLMAVTRMGAAEENARRMKDEYVPEVAVAGKLERHSLLTMFAMRGYALSGNGKLFTEGTGELAQVKKHLEDARLLGEKYPHLAKLRQGVATAQAKVTEYENMAGQTKLLLEQQAKVRADRLSVGAVFLKKADAFLASQNAKLKEDISSEAPNARLLERQGKIQAMTKVIEGVTGIRIKALSGDAGDDLSMYESALPLFAGIEAEIAAMRPLVTSKEDIEALEGILKDLPVYKGLVEKQIVITRSVLDLGVKRNQAGLDVLEAARAVAEAGMGQVSELADESEEKLDASATILQAGLLFAIVLGAAIAVFITRAISGPVAKGVEFAKTVAAGDYGSTLDIDQKDEIGQLAVSLNAMVQSLKEKIAEANAKSEEAAIQAKNANEAMGEAEKSRLATDEAMARMLRVAAKLQQVAEVLTSASEELSAQVEQSSRGAENQAQRVSETATAMEEMNSTVLEVAKNAAMASDTATGARTKAEEGARVVGQVVKAIKDVEEQALALKKDMSSLGSQAEGIGQIMNVISDIADQTNLLALNAAIEAARAGEAGRGFAVVADEVRKLAEKTMAATKEVGDSIAGIQQGTRTNIENVERTVGTIEEVTSLSVRSGQSLAEIVSMVESATDQVRSIATASEEQSSASEEINRSIEEVATISSETSQAMAQAAQAVSQLARQAVVLKGLVDDMQQGADTQGPIPMIPAGGRAVLSLS